MNMNYTPTAVSELKQQNEYDEDLIMPYTNFTDYKNELSNKVGTLNMNTGGLSTGPSTQFTNNNTNSNKFGRLDLLMNNNKAGNVGENTKFNSNVNSLLSILN